MPNLFRVILPVAGIEEAARWYGLLFSDTGKRVSPGRHYFRCGACILACYDAVADGDAEEPLPPNPDHLYFSVADLEAVHEKVGAAKAAIEVQPWGERSFYCQDPFGNKLCFVDERTCFTGD